MRILALFAFCLNLLTANAQDTSLQFNAQRLMLQNTFSPSSAYDNGRNFVALQWQHSYSPDMTLSDEMHFSYSTHLKYHSIGINYNRSVFAAKEMGTSVGLQYAYTIRFHKTFLGKNTVLIPGIELAYANRVLYFDKLTFFDQIDPNLGFVRPTSERAGMDERSYFMLPVSLLLRSENMYFHYQCSSLGEPFISYYYESSAADQFKQKRTHSFVTGLNVVQHDKVSVWLNAQYTYNPSYDIREARFNGSGAGLTMKLFNKWMVGYNYKHPSNEITAGYYAKHIRVYTRYQDTPNPYSGYFSFGKFSLGISTAIGKQ